MKPLVILVPGFNNSGEYIRRIEPYLIRAGYETKVFLYKKPTPVMLMNVVANRFRTKRILGELVNAIYKAKGDVILMGHSNGGMLSWAAQNLCSQVIGCVVFNAALNRNTLFKNWVINCYCETDWTLKIGARYRPFSKWGDYGSRKQSHVGADDLDLSNYSVKSHSDFIDHLSSIMPEIVTRIKSLSP